MRKEHNAKTATIGDESMLRQQQHWVWTVALHVLLGHSGVCNLARGPDIR